MSITAITSFYAANAASAVRSTSASAASKQSTAGTSSAPTSETRDVAARHEDLDTGAEEPPLALVAVGRLDRDVAAQDVTLEAIEARRLLADAVLQRRRCLDALEGDLQRNGRLWPSVRPAPHRQAASLFVDHSFVGCLSGHDCAL